MNIGAHIPSKNAIEEIKLRKGDTFQIFISSPQMWKSPKPREDVDVLQEYDGPIYVHAPYLINVATQNNKVRHPSRKLLKDTCKVAASFGAKGVIVHGGSVGEGGDIGVGYDNWRKAIEHVEDTGMRVLVENTAGGKNSVARYMDSIERLWEVIGHLNVGLCLDTCHTWAGGIPTEKAVKGFTKHEADCSGEVPSFISKQLDAGKHLYSEYIAPPATPTVFPIKCSAPFPATSTTPEPSFPTGRF